MNGKSIGILIAVVLIAGIGIFVATSTGGGGNSSSDTGKLTVTYDLNGGTGNVVDPNTYNEGDSVSLKFNPAPAKDGYAFSGWSDSKYFGNVYTEPTSIIITKSITLYAVWSEVYHLYYDMNGGSGSIVDNNDYKSGDKAIVKFSPEPVKNGYKFAGWTTSSTSTYVYYNPGDTLQFFYSDEILYAVYRQTVSYSYDISYADSFTYTMTIGSSTYEYEAIAGSGYKFAFAHITVTNNSVSKGFSPSYLDFEFSGNDGIRYSKSILECIYYNEEKMKIMDPHDITLSPGTSFTYYITYKVPSNVACSDLIGVSWGDYVFIKN